MGALVVEHVASLAHEHLGAGCAGRRPSPPRVAARRQRVWRKEMRADRHLVPGRRRPHFFIAAAPQRDGDDVRLVQAEAAENPAR